MEQGFNHCHPINNIGREGSTHPLNACEPVDHADMHKVHSHNRRNMIPLATDKPPFGAGFEQEELKDAVRLEVWQTLFRHESPRDFTTFELYDIDDNLVGIKKIYDN